MDKDKEKREQIPSSANGFMDDRPMDRNIVPPEDTNLNHMPADENNEAPADESIEEELRNHEATTERD